MSGSLVFYLVGMALLFVAERLVGGEHTSRFVLVVAALGLLVATIVLRAGAIKRADPKRKGAEKTALLLTGVGLASLALYALSLPAVATALGAEAGGRLTSVLTAIWPIVWLAGSLPLILVDWALGQMPAMTQPRRVRHATQMGLCIAFAVSLAFPLNYLANRHSNTYDLRQIRTTAPGEATRALVEALAEPVEIYLFFPPANDVHQELRPYFEALERLSEMLEVQTVDQAVALELSRRLQVSSNGTVVLARGSNDTERINLGSTLEGARGQLRRFDELFQNRLLQLTRTESTIYFTVGHEEMHWSPMEDEPPTRQISTAKRVLEQLNFKVSELGVGEGLGRAIPDDAAAVVIAGPKQPFLPEEIASLREYADAGGRILLLLEPGEERHAELTSILGVRFHTDLIHSDRHHLIRTRTKADRAIIGTNRFSSHPSVGTLSRHSSRLMLIADGAGWLETTPGDGLRVSATIRSMPDSWADVIPNHELDAGTEERRTWEIGAAASRDTDTGSFRGAVLANSNAISDPIIGNQGNLQWLVDTLRWLTDDEAVAGLVETEEDIRIQHTREQDVMWFYGTIFAVPLLVLVGGVVHVKRRRKRSA